MEKTMVNQVVPLQPMEDPCGADIHNAASGGWHTGVGGCSLKDAGDHGEPMLEQAPGSTSDPEERSPY
ncbi:hypothetical protein llap_6721 [Limosa lapponica baueri]|uniref:Uncharacterized protein n=1 Tax=Limosa lapponica baueri TaxID=1758121 RepID=A0A2I0UA85_LIMLA|nr:hypothetical protein llap_6721 [Limosa lapponica baueri]